MNALMDYIRVLVLVVLMLRVTEMLAPEGEMKSYVRFICGVLLLLAIISPLVNLVPAIEGSMSSLADGGFAAPSVSGQVLAERGREEAHEQTLALYGERLAAFIAEELRGLSALRNLDLHPEVQLQVRDEGEIEWATVYLFRGDPRETEADEEGIGVSSVRISTIRIGDDRPSQEDEGTADEIPGDVHGEIVNHLVSRYRLRQEEIAVLWGE